MIHSGYTKATCADCIHWAETGSQVQDPTVVVGECRLHPPVSTQRGWEWPMTAGGEWCGRHVIKPGPKPSQIIREEMERAEADLDNVLEHEIERRAYRMGEIAGLTFALKTMGAIKA